MPLVSLLIELLHQLSLRKAREIIMKSAVMATIWQNPRASDIYQTITVAALGKNPAETRMRFGWRLNTVAGQLALVMAECR